MAELGGPDLDLLDTLRRRVRVLSLAQVAGEWWAAAGDPLRSAARQVERLEAGGHVETCRFFARPEVALEAPLATWQRGLALPDFRSVSLRARRRWSAPPITIRCLVATRAGKRGGRTPRETEATHDIHLAQVYLRMRRELPTRARSWTGESDVRDREERGALTRNDDPRPGGEKLPDAMVRDGRHLTAIEMVGESYRPQKLAQFHEFCATERLAYELW